MEKNIAYSYNKHLFSTLVELVAIEDIEVCDYILMPDGYFLCVDDIEKEFRDDDDDDEFEYYFGDEDSDDEDSVCVSIYVYIYLCVYLFMCVHSVCVYLCV